MSSHIIGTVFTRIMVPNLSGNKDWFCGRVFPWMEMREWGGAWMVWAVMPAMGSGK